MRTLMFFLLSLVVFPPLAQAANHELNLPLDDGKLRSETLTSEFLKKLHLPGIGYGSYSLDVAHYRDSNFVSAINKSLSGAARIDITNGNLHLALDLAKLPRSIDAAKQTIRTFTATAAPDAAARQQRAWGLLMPKHVDQTRRMVILLHGLDVNRSNWGPMTELLKKDGYQVAYFAYPSDGPLEDSVALLATEMAGVKETFPSLRTSVIAHSMGGLVARAYVEGDKYHHNVDHLILLGTPNQGSSWATYRVGLEFREHWNLWRSDADWSPTWIITDGLGEAGRDLKPESRFLMQLNSRPRRQNVRYTIVAGNQHLAHRLSASALDCTANIIPNPARSWWGVKHAHLGLNQWSRSLRQTKCQSDGPVTTKSTKLQGVDDFTILPADHNSLYYPVDNAKSPAAWSIIQNRLRQ